MQVKAGGAGAPRIVVMLMHSGTLSEHHRRCDALFAAARQAVSAEAPAQLASSIAELRDALLEHFRYEEEHLFPLYEQACGAADGTQWLRAEHDDMRAILWMLATAAASERARYSADLAELQALFEAHAADEESRMYPVFERLLAR
jgi:hypothetical protein